MSAPWYAGEYTGLFRQCGPVPPRPHDPAVCIWAGTLPRWGPDGSDLAVGGAGWDSATAEAAGVGEAVERWQCRPSPRDCVSPASCEEWSLDEPCIDPGRWVLFHPDQYAAEAFPFRPLKRRSVVGWVSARRAVTGEPFWVPEEFVYLALGGDRRHAHAPAISTGLSAGPFGAPVLLRGLQEVVERDALMGAWWGSYPLEEHDPQGVFAALPPSLPDRLRRPNLRYRFYRIASPFSAHVTVVTVEGEDHEGFCFSAGSACREGRAASWQKAILEAVQGRHFVRHLKPRAAEHLHGGLPVDFAAHALYYSLYPERLADTVLARAAPVPSTDEEELVEPVAALVERLGAERPVLFRLVTPPALTAERLGWVVLRVLVPGLQPMHGHHGYPFLGGPLWAPRGLGDWQAIPPHPFP